MKHRNKNLIIVMIVLVVVIAIGAMALMNQNVLEQTSDSYTHEAGRELALDPTEFFDVDEFQAKQITFDTSTVDEDTIGVYTATASFKGKTFEIKVNVVDTQVPDVTFLSRYVITNDLENPSLEQTIEHVYDASEWTAKLVRFEYKGTLQVMDETVLKSLTDTIPVPCDAEELKAIGTEELPTEEGIYRAILEIADTYENRRLEEVYVIYDTTGARIDETPDKIITAATEDLDKEPVIDKSDYIITDNVDGKIAEDQVSCELELRDAEEHEWLVHVSYTDRAGNESKADFLIIVEEDTSVAVNNRDNADKDTTDDKTSNNDASNNENAGNKDTNSDKDASSDKNNSNSGSGNDNTTSNNGNTSNSGSVNNTEYDPADTNKDGVVDSQEASDNISIYEQMVIDAGYGVIVEIDTNVYAVLTHGDGYVNGKDGGDILIDYLAERDLVPESVSGGWIDENNDWYWYIAKNIRELITPDDEEFWD